MVGVRVPMKLHNGELAEWLGGGLQNLLHKFDPCTRLGAKDKGRIAWRKSQESGSIPQHGVWSFKVKHEFVELGKTAQYRPYTQQSVLVKRFNTSLS